MLKPVYLPQFLDFAEKSDERNNIPGAFANMTEQQIIDKYGPVVATVSSKSSPGKSYQVRLLDGAWSCGCAGWKFRRECRHIQYCVANGITNEDTSIIDEAVGKLHGILKIDRFADLLLAKQREIAKQILNTFGGTYQEPEIKTNPGGRMIILED